MIYLFLGDFAILIQSGMSLRRAMCFNFLSACTAFIGLIIGICLGNMEYSGFVFSFAGGLFLFITLTHLVSQSILITFKIRYINIAIITRIYNILQLWVNVVKTKEWTELCAIVCNDYTVWKRFKYTFFQTHGFWFYWQDWVFDKTNNRVINF